MTKPNIAERIIKPENCVLAFGIPTSRDDFFRDLASDNKEFAKLYNGVWSRYDEEIVKYITRYEPALIQLGVNIIHRLTVEMFGELCRNDRVDVIVLFSHWNADAIEFHDGFAKHEQILDQIPADYSGFIDLCVCHPENLTKALRKYRPKCLTRFTNKPVTPYVWLYFYLDLFNHLKLHEVTYLKALEEIISKYFKSESVLQS